MKDPSPTNKDSASPRLNFSMYMWWFQYAPGKYWSYEERWLRLTVFAIAIPVVVAIIELLSRMLMDLGLNEKRAAFIAFIASLPLAIIFSRCLCTLFWPRKVRQAEENAAKRMRSSPNRW